ncbi:MAG TPA: hypothetical protein VFF13_03535 [archaeon]|nr:hypothetical protein [archaeon]
MLARGFIGPIGDDLPSLIPLLVGLVMFFSTFTLTFNAFDHTNREVDNDISVMRISRTLQSNSYIFGYDNFASLCERVGTVNIKYVAGLSSQGTLHSDGYENVKSIFDVKFFTDSENDTFVCSNSESHDSIDLVKNYLSLEESQSNTVVTRIFPIVVEDEKIVKPMHLFVVAWK